MRAAVLVAIALVATAANAQPGIGDQCPNAAAALLMTFPLDLPTEVKSGEAIVDFTIGPDGTVTDAAATSSSNPAFVGPAVAAVKSLSCNPRKEPERFSLPMSFAKPNDLPRGRCLQSLRQLLKDTDFDRSSVRSGNDLAVVDFTLQPSGQVTDITVLRASSQAFASDVISLYQHLKCSTSEEAQRVRTGLGLSLSVRR